MTRTKLRIALLVLVGSILVVSPASAEEPASFIERSSLETPDPVSEVWLSFTGSDQLNAAASAGIDVEHNIVRVPTGIEAPALVTQEQLALLDTMGVEVIPDADRFGRDLSSDGAQSFALRSGASSPFSSFETLLALDHDATVRVVRADWFTTKGQGFLYVEARTTEGQQTDPIVGDAARERLGQGHPVRLRPHDEPIRRLRAVHVPPEPVQARRPPEPDPGHQLHRRRHHRRRLRLARGPLAAADRDPGYKSNFIDSYKTPQQLYGRAEEIAGQYPDIAEIIYLPNKTNGYQRKAQATIGGTGQAAVVVDSAAWGHEGGNDITVEFVDRRARRPPARRRGDRQGDPRPARQGRHRCARRVRPPRCRGAGPVAGPDRPVAPVPHQRGHRHRRRRRPARSR